MGMRNTGGQSTLDRYLPVPPGDAYQALERVVRRGFAIKHIDDFTLTVEFSSGASLMTWGERFSAQVVPTEAGSTVRVHGVGKVGGQMMQNARLHKLINGIFDDLTTLVRPQPETAIDGPPPLVE